jgi:hypothetical protein
MVETFKIGTTNILRVFHRLMEFTFTLFRLWILSTNQAPFLPLDQKQHSILSS